MTVKAVGSFGRIVTVRVYATVIQQTTAGGLTFPTISYSNGYTEFSSVQTDGSPGYRIKGKCVQVQPTVGFNTNQITFSIYNLGPDSRALFQSKIGTKIEIFAGYGKNVKQIALGDILWCRTIKDADTSYVTNVVAGDSHFAQTNGLINRSFTGPTTYQQVVNALLEKLEENEISSGNIQLPTSGGYKNGIVLAGSPFDELARVCGTMGRVMSIVGGTVNILPPGTDDGSPILLISTDTGMIGIPEINPPGIIGYVPPGNDVSPDLDVSFTHLLRPELTLSKRVQIVSKFVNGNYVVLHNEFLFDSWSGPFYNRCECGKVVTGVQ